jgi:hypothetical protein
VDAVTVGAVNSGRMGLSGLGRGRGFGAALVLPLLAASMLGGYDKFLLPGDMTPAAPKPRKRIGDDYRNQNGSRECARRRRQIERGMLRVT